MPKALLISGSYGAGYISFVSRGHLYISCKTVEGPGEALKDLKICLLHKLFAIWDLPAKAGPKCLLLID